MRRSKMLNIIAETLVSYGVDLKDNEGIAYEVLDSIEKAGMLPPAIDGKHSFLCDENGMMNEWEDE